MDFQGKESFPSFKKKSKKHKKHSHKKNTYSTTDSDSDISKQQKQKVEASNFEVISSSNSNKHNKLITDESLSEVSKDILKKHKKKKKMQCEDALNVDSTELQLTVPPKKKNKSFSESVEIKTEPSSPERQHDDHYVDENNLNSELLHHSINLGDFEVKSEESFNLNSSKKLNQSISSVKKGRKKKRHDDTFMSTDYSLNCSFSTNTTLDECNGKSDQIDINEEPEVPYKKKKKKKRNREQSELGSDIGCVENSEADLKSNRREYKIKEEEEISDAVDFNIHESHPQFIKEESQHTEQSVDDPINDNGALTENLSQESNHKKKKKQSSHKVLESESLNEPKRKKEKHKSSEREADLEQERKLKKKKQKMSDQETASENDSERPRKSKKKKRKENSPDRVAQDNLAFKELDEELAHKKKKKHKITENGTDSDQKPVTEAMKIEELSSDESVFTDRHSNRKKKEHKHSERSDQESEIAYKNFEDAINDELKTERNKVKSEFTQNRYSSSPDRLSGVKTEFSLESTSLENEDYKNIAHDFRSESCYDDAEDSNESDGFATSSRISDSKYSELRRKNLQTFSELDFSDDDNEAVGIEADLHSLLKAAKGRQILTEEDSENLSSLKIEIPWPVPELHLIETRVAGRPTESQRQHIVALRTSIKTGSYTKAEDETIKINFVNFCQDHNLPLDCTPFLNFRHIGSKCSLPTTERINFVRYLAHGLEDRMLCSVYNRFKRLFNQTRNGRFTDEEDNLIIQYMRKQIRSRTPYADLAKLLNRDKLAIEKRCYKLEQQFRSDSSIGKWDKNRIDEFKQHLMDVLQVKDVEELKGRDITPREWQKMSERMKLPIDKLRRAWSVKIAASIFLKHKINTHLIKRRLISLLISRGEKSWDDIDWNAVANQMDVKYEELTSSKIKGIMKQMIKSVPEEKRSDLGECLDYLAVNLTLNFEKPITKNRKEEKV